MSTSSQPVPNPQRLITGKLGPLLEDANREFAQSVDQKAAFQRVLARLSTSRTFWPRRSYWLVPAALVVGAAFVTLAPVLRRARLGDPPSVIAEDLGAFHSERAIAPSSAAVASLPSEPTPQPHLEGRSAVGSKPNPQHASSLAAAKSAAPDCLSLARHGQTRDAEACFLKRAEGSGLSAEMALYEVARLRRDVLADPAGALAALGQYRTRFPAGSLRREADMSHLELLLQLGRTDEALKQSDELLSSSSSGERAAELHLLRGHIFRKVQSRFADAAREYELAERAGAPAAESTYFRALCLEALGQASQAAALFAKYLEQPQRAYAEDARRRLQRLTP